MTQAAPRRGTTSRSFSITSASVWRLAAYAFILLVAVGGTFRYHDVITGVWELYEGGVRECDSVAALDFSDVFDVIVDPNDNTKCLIAAGATLTGAIQKADLPTEAARTDVANNWTVGQNLSPGTTLAENDVIANELGAGTDVLFFCGDLRSSSGTWWYAPQVAHFWGSSLDTEADIGFNTTHCQGEDATTETNDALIIEDIPFKVMGMACRTSADPALDVTCRLRTGGAANLTPDVACLISGTAKSCLTTTATTTDVAAGATIGMACVTAGSESTVDVICKAYIAWK